MNAMHLKGYDLVAAQEHFQARTQFTTGAHELEVLIGEAAKADVGEFRIVDVRYPGDFAKGHVPGAINLPKNKWGNAAAIEKAGLSKDGINYLYCYNPTCHLAAESALELTRLGYRVVEVEGGWSTWVGNGYAIEPAAASVAA